MKQHDSVTISKEITKDWAWNETMVISTRNQLQLTQNHDRTQASCFQYGQEIYGKQQEIAKVGGQGGFSEAIVTEWLQEMTQKTLQINSRAQ